MMKNKALVAALAGAGVALALFVYWRQSSKPAMNLRPSAAVGEVLAGEATRLLGGTGRLVVVGRASARDGQSAAAEQLASFAAAMKRRGAQGIIATEWLPRPPAGAMDLGGVTADQLSELIEKHPEANAFAVFAGMPQFSASLAGKLATKPIKLVAVCGYGPNVRRWLETRALALAIVPRFGELPPGNPAPKTVMDWFAREFEMLTPESVARLPY